MEHTKVCQSFIFASLVPIDMVVDMHESSKFSTVVMILFPTTVDERHLRSGHAESSEMCHAVPLL
jgi:hypothetical protein